MNRTLRTIAAAVLALAGLELFVLHWLQPLENRLLDSFVRSKAALLAPDPDIVIVDIDEKSLAVMEKDAGRWPWPRVVHATLVDGLAAQHPRAIVFDMPFVEADTFRPRDDAAFAEAVGRHPNIYFPLLRLQVKNEKDRVRLADVAQYLGLLRQSDADPDARAGLVPPLILSPKDWRVGLITFTADEDGVGRRYLLRDVTGGWQIPSLPARVAFDLGFPVPDANDIVLAWRGDSRGFPRVSYSDLYEDFNRLKRARPPNEFAGKIVIIGSAATALEDLRVTPITSVHPGAEILGTAIENLKSGRHMRYASPWWAAGIGVVLLGFLFFAFGRRLDVRVIGAALGLASGALLFLSFAATEKLLLLPVLTPLAAVWAFYLAAALDVYLRERTARREAVAQFSRFLNPHVVKQLLEQGGIQGAGQSREVTLLFSDIRGFTTLSETKRPQEVVSMLNRYFSMQVDVVLRHRGTLDKYIGDCIMAFWGAPLDDAEQARNAVACALDMADTLEAFKREVGTTDSNFDVGIGLHTGAAVVGFIGSEKKREYTAIGDTVNLASRIEGLTKDAKRRILVSRDTMERCAGAFDFVSCGTFPVKGRAQPVELFEPRRK